MALFPLPVKAELADSLILPSKILQFGDGYEQLMSDGFNSPIEVWDVITVLPNSTASDLLQTFLIDHGQDKIFTWRSPRDKTPQKYRIKGKVSGTRRNGGGSKPVFFTRSMQFESLPKDLSVALTSTTYSFPSHIKSLPTSTTYSF